MVACNRALLATCVFPQDPFLPVLARFSFVSPCFFSLHTSEGEEGKKQNLKVIHPHCTSYWQPLNYMVIFPMLKTMTVQSIIKSDKKIKLR